jgi:hypothetical protein
MDLSKMLMEKNWVWREYAVTYVVYFLNLRLLAAQVNCCPVK